MRPFLFLFHPTLCTETGRNVASLTTKAQIPNAKGNKVSEGEYVGKMKSDDWDWYDKVYHPTCSLFPSTCSLPCRSMCKYGDRQNKKKWSP